MGLPTWSTPREKVEVWCQFNADGPIDAFTSELPDIDAEEDMKNMKEKDKLIDQDVEQLGQGVQRLRDIAIDMGSVSPWFFILGIGQATGRSRQSR